MQKQYSEGRLAEECIFTNDYHANSFTRLLLYYLRK